MSAVPAQTCPAAKPGLQLTHEVAELKRAIHRHRARSRWTRIAALIGSVVVGLGTWFGEPPTDRDELHFGFALGLAGATFFIGCLLDRLLFLRPAATCPQCGCDWNLESDNDAERLLAWHCCPCCGLKIGDESRGHEQPGQLTRTNSRLLSS